MKMLRIIYNKMLPSLFWIMLLLAFDSVCVTLLTLFAAALHELGHIAAATIVLNKSIPLPKAALYGLRIDTGGIISYREELFLALGGPLANIFIFFTCLPFFYLNDYISAFLFINLLTAISNLLPLRSYDGQRILCCFIAPYVTPYVSETVTHYTCISISSLGCFATLFLIGILGDGYWIFGVFFVTLINEIFVQTKKQVAL